VNSAKVEIRVSESDTWLAKMELTIPHGSPLYHTGDNIFMKYNLAPFLRKLSPSQIFMRSNPIHA
jgi:hypothetical protein